MGQTQTSLAGLVCGSDSESDSAPCQGMLVQGFKPPTVTVTVTDFDCDNDCPAAAAGLHRVSQAGRLLWPRVWRAASLVNHRLRLSVMMQAYCQGLDGGGWRQLQGWLDSGLSLNELLESHDE